LCFNSKVVKGNRRMQSGASRARQTSASFGTLADHRQRGLAVPRQTSASFGIQTPG